MCRAAGERVYNRIAGDLAGPLFKFIKNRENIMLRMGSMWDDSRATSR